MADTNEITHWVTELQTGNLDQRAAAAERLCLAGPDASDAVVALVQACSDEEIVREWAVSALESLETPSAQWVAPLTELTDSADPLVAYWAVTMLGRLGPAAAAGEEKLAKLLEHTAEACVRERAAWALGKIGVSSSAARNALSQAAKAGDPRLSRLAQASLNESPV